MTHEFLLQHLRAARIRAELAAVEIDLIGIALRSEMICTDEALQWLHDIDTLRYLLPPDEEAA